MLYQIFGKIEPTVLPSSYQSVTSGLPLFISNVVKLVIVAAGLFAFFNLVFAGFTYVTSGGDQKRITQALTAINMSLIGLVIIVGSFALTAIVGYILFGDPAVILKPTIYGPGSL